MEMLSLEPSRCIIGLICLPIWQYFPTSLRDKTTNYFYHSLRGPSYMYTGIVDSPILCSQGYREATNQNINNARLLFWEACKLLGETEFILKPDKLSLKGNLVSFFRNFRSSQWVFMKQARDLKQLFSNLFLSMNLDK